MTHVTIYSRPGCHLCDDMKAVVEAVGRTVPLAIEIVDISNDAQLNALYSLEIPVLMVEGKKAAKYRVTDAELRAIIRGRTQSGGSGESGGSGGSGGSGRAGEAGKSHE